MIALRPDDEEHELSELRRAESLIAAQNRVLDLVASGASLDALLLAVAGMVEQHTSAHCAIMVPDSDGGTLRFAATPTLPRRLAEALDGLTIGPAAASCGAAAHRRAPVLVRDVETDPFWREHRALMASLELRAAWSTPVLSADRDVLATVALYAREARLPDEWETRVVGSAVALTSVAIQRSRAGRLAEENEGRFRLLWETSTDAVILMDAESRIRFANAAVADVFGYAAEEVVGRDLAMLHPEHFVDAHRASVARYVASGETRPARRMMTGTGRHKDGHEFPIEIAFSDLQIDGTRQFAGFMRDVSARAHADDALRRGEARYRALAENAFDMVCELDRQGRFAYTSPNFRDVLGYEPEGLIGTSPFELIHPDDRERVIQQFADAISENAPPGTSAFRLKRADDTWAWLEVSANFFRDDEGESRAVILARDIGERMAMEQTLRESEERLRVFVENAPVILFASDANGVFTLYEGAGLERVGLRPGQFVGRSIVDVHRDTPRVGENLSRALAGEAFSDLVEIGEVTFEVHHAPLRDDAGVVTGMIGILIDATARVRAEAALRKSEARLRTFVKNAPLVLFGTDAEGVFTLFDGKGVEALGVKRDQYVGQSIFVALGAYPEIVDSARRVLAGETTTFVFRGQRIAIEVHHAPVLDDSGAITGTIGVVIDVSDRTRAEEALRKSEERYRAIFETHRVVRLLVDPATALIEEANQAASEFYGYPVEEMAGMPITTISTTLPQQIHENVRHAGEGDPTVLHRTHRLKSGELRDVDLFAAPVEVEGRRLLYGIVQDVTEQRWAESLVSAQQRLLEMVAVAAPLADVLGQLAVVFEERAPGALCSILLLSPEGTQLRHVAAPSLPAAYAQAIDGITIGPQVGSCGTAAYLRREVVVEDIASDPLWADFRDLALSHGLQSCWSTPILSATGEVLATFAVYHRDTGGVRARERSLIEIATHVAGIAIERERAETSMRKHTEELERTYRRLADAHAELEESKQHLEEKSFLLERGLELERERSRRDQLTGALNHAAITDVIREMIREDAGRSLAIAMVDVDGLKAANDTYGHQVGDAVLVLVAQKLMREGAVVGRYGGDEFVAIVPGADRRAAEQYRDCVLASLVGAGLTDERTGSHIPVVASIGLAVYPEEAEAVDDLIRLSDSAMYASRRQRVTDGGDVQSRSLGSDRAAKMIGELVPLLTSPGALDDKLRLVAHRLSVGAGYDAVNFVVAGLGGARRSSTAIPGVPERDLEEWNRRQLATDGRLVGSFLLRTMKPFIIDDLETTPLVADDQRLLLTGAGLRCALAAPMIWEDQLIGALTVASKRQNAFTLRDIEFIGAVATQVTAIVRMSSLVEELQASTAQLQQSHEGTVLMLASAAEAHDHTTGRHLQRVRQLSEAIARELGYDDDGAAALGMAATLHDIGKIRVPDSVLGSSNSLAEAEWVLMKQHTLWGSAFLREQPGFELAASVARHHHERWDGAGYPDGLAGEEIPASALITTVADSFDAMTNHRPYRRGMPVDEAVREIAACSGTQFSPRVVDALVRLFERGELAFIGPDEDDDRAQNAA